MKRLFLFLLSLLCMTSIIMSDENVNIHDDFTLKVDQISFESQKSTIIAYKQICDDVSQDTVYAMLLHDYAASCAKFGQSETAIEAITESLNIFKSVYGEKSREYVTKLIQFARHFSRLGNYQEAMRLCAKAKDILKEIVGEDDILYVTALNNLAKYNGDIGNYDKAIELGAEALEIKRRIYGVEHSSYALSLNNLANNYANLGNYKEAIRLETEALAIDRTVLGENHPEFLNVLSDLIFFNSELGNYKEALRFGTEKLELIKKTSGENTTEYASILGDLSLYNYELQNYEEAVKLKTKAIEIQKSIMNDNNPDYLSSLGFLALCYSHLDNYYEAIRLATEVVEICKRDSVYHPVLFTSLSFLATCYYEIGNYNKAIQLENKANHYREEPLYTNSLDYSISLRRLALFYSKLKNHKEAVQLATKALEIIKTNSGTLNSDYATLLGDLAGFYSDLKDYDEAIRLGSESSRILKDVHGKMNPYYITALSNLAGYYYQLENYDKAIQLVTESIELRKKASDTDNPDYAISLNTLALCYSKLGKHEEATRIREEASTIKQTTSLPDPSYYVDTMMKLVDFYKSSGRKEEADSLFSEVMDYLKKVTQDYLKSLNDLTNSQIEQWRFDEAIQYINVAMEFFEDNQITDFPQYANLLSYLAQCFAALGNYHDAIQAENRAMEIYKSTLGIEHPDYVQSLHQLAVFFHASGDYHNAYRIGNEAMEIAKKFHGLETPEYAESLEILASINNSIGNYGEAILLGKEAMEIIKKKLGTDNTEYAGVLHLLSGCYADIRKYDKALQLESESAEIFKSTIGQDKPRYAQAINGLALLYAENKDYDNAIQLEMEAIEIIEKALGKNDLSYAKDLNNLAIFYSEIGKPNEAIQLNKEALEIVQRSFGKGNPDYAVILSNLAFKYSEAKEYESAIPLLMEYLSLIKENILHDFSWMTSNERFWYWLQYERAVHAISAIFIKSGLSESTPELYDTNALFAKGLLLSAESGMAKLIQEGGDEEALHLYSELRQNRQILNTQYSSPITERVINCDSLEQASSNLERQLVSRVKRFGEFSRDIHITWRDIQNRLEDTDIAIEFLSYPENDGTTAYAALTLCKNDSKPELTRLFTTSEMKEASADDDTYHTLKVDSLVWMPLSSRLEGKSHVYFSASGMLHSIGIEYLPSMDGKECYRLSSTRELVTHQPAASLKSAALFGGIAYDSTYTAIRAELPIIDQNKGNTNLMASIDYNSSYEAVKDVFTQKNSDGDLAMNSEDRRGRGTFGHRALRYGVLPLKYAQPEVRKVSAMLDSIGVPCDTLTGIQANEESFKALSGQRKSLIHIATHGFYYDSDEMENLSDRLGITLGKGKTPIHAEDQLLSRCGLCFAGANQILQDSLPPYGQDDGILTALEIAQTDLRGLDLVVLSACQTALGDIAMEEGTFGLQRGFKKAGAQSILMSLWEVDDEATHLLMTEFYKGWTSGLSKYAALRQAQSIVKKKYPDPKYWAAFILLDALD